ncbi:transporter [Longitalea luteola]|uniref:transporter n=1 Tax=Longitalea luteola TaxID=2812563 RepID=UPI001A96F001|nr:transporter [Longitalea luteola]
MRRIIIMVLVLYSCVFRLYSQEKEMNTDRPDQTEETHLVNKRQVQVETGLLYNDFDTGRSAIITRTLIRYGISSKWELGVLVEQGRERDRYMKETVQSTYPLAVRFKAAVLEDHKWLPDITVIGYLQLPYTAVYTNGGWRRSASLLAAFLHEVGDDWKIEYNAGFQQEAFGPDMTWLVNGSIHYKPAERLEMFAGYFSQFESQEDPIHNLDAGIQYKIRDNLQIDLAAGSSILHDNPNRFLTIGLSIAIPK